MAAHAVSLSSSGDTTKTSMVENAQTKNIFGTQSLYLETIQQNQIHCSTACTTIELGITDIKINMYVHIFGQICA